MISQIRIETNEKKRCTVQDDNIECFRTSVTTIFTVDYSLNRILQEEESQKTIFVIDSKAFPSQETILYNVHSATGERLTITISDRSVKIQSLVYKDQYTQFDF